MDYSIVGNRIRTYRLAKGMTQFELAEAAGLSERTISCIEHARKRVKLDSLLCIASALNVSPDALLTGVGSNSTELCAQQLFAILVQCTPEDRRLILEISEKLAKRLTK